VRAAELGSGATGSSVAPRRIVVLRFTGTDADVIQAAVIEKLNDEPSIEVVPLRKALALPDLPGGPEKNPAETARRLELAALVSGRIKRAHHKLQAELTVLGGEQGQILGRTVFTAQSPLALYAAVRVDLWRRLGPLIDQVAPNRVAADAARRGASVEDSGSTDAHRDESPSAGTPAAAPERSERSNDRLGAETKPASPAAVPVAGEGNDHPDDEESDERPPAPPPQRKAVLHRAAARARSPARCAFLEAEVGGGSQFRWFNYRDEQEGALRAFTLRGIPVGHFEATVYPFAYSSCGPLSHVGLRGGGERTFSATARLADQRLGTVLYTAYGEVPVAFSVGPAVLRVAPGFLLGHAWVDKNEVPDVDYKAATLTFEGELRIHSMLLGLGLGGLYVLSAGDIQSARWFPRTRAYGVTGRAVLGAAVTDHLDLLVEARTELYNLDFRIVMDRTYQNGIAAGAHDRYLVTLLALRARFGGAVQ
jgi:hypothetical protein